MFDERQNVPVELGSVYIWLPESAAIVMVPVFPASESRTSWFVELVRFRFVPVIAPDAIDTPLIVFVVLAVIVPAIVRLPDELIVLLEPKN